MTRTSMLAALAVSLSSCGNRQQTRSTAKALARSAGDDPSQPVEIDVLRQHSGADCNSGYLSVNQSIVCYTLERPTADNQPLFSSIPAGTYQAHLRYDHSDHWRFQLDNVPDRTLVQIHVGNQLDQTIGCILVGSQLGKDLCSLQDSAKAYAAFKTAVYGAVNDDDALPPELGVIVKISDPG